MIVSTSIVQNSVLCKYFMFLSTLFLLGYSTVSCAIEIDALQNPCKEENFKSFREVHRETLKIQFPTSLKPFLAVASGLPRTHFLRLEKGHILGFVCELEALIA